MTKVEKWATAKKLSEKTAETLIELGFDSMESFSLLTGDDLEDTDIPLGQRKLLLHAVKATFPEGALANENPGSEPAGEDPVVHNIGQPLGIRDDRDEFVNNVLRQLQPNCQTHAAQNAPLPGVYSHNIPKSI